MISPSAPPEWIWIALERRRSPPQAREIVRAERLQPLRHLHRTWARCRPTLSGEAHVLRDNVEHVWFVAIIDQFNANLRLLEIARTPALRRRPRSGCVRYHCGERHNDL